MEQCHGSKTGAKIVQYNSLGMRREVAEGGGLCKLCWYLKLYKLFFPICVKTKKPTISNSTHDPSLVFFLNIPGTIQLTYPVTPVSVYSSRYLIDGKEKHLFTGFD